MIYLVTGCLLFIFVILFIFFSYRQKKKLFTYLKEKNFIKMDQLLDNSINRVFIDTYTKEYVLLNRYRIEQNKKGVQNQLNTLLQMPLNEARSNEIIHIAFNYYLEQKDKGHCLEILEKMDSNSPMYAEAKMIYDIFLDHKANYIEPLKQQALQYQNEKQASIYTLIAQQYENIHDLEQAHHYHSLAKQALHH